MVRLVHYSDIENVFDAPDRAARLAGRIRALDGPDAAVVGTGDTTAPGVLSLVAQGRQTLDFYAATDTVLDTFGNHEFDYGPDALRGLVADAPVEFVSANVRDEDGNPFGREEGVVPWTVRQVGGARVGFLGLTDPATDSLNPMAEPLDFDDPLPAAREALDALRAEGVDYAVALSHLGSGDDELARELDLDAVLGGHVHSLRNEHVDDTLLVRPGVNGEAVVEVDFSGDRATATLHETNLRGESADSVESAADGGSEIATHGGLQEALTQRMAEADLDEVVGHAPTPIERTGDVVHGGECRIGNFVADAFRWAHDADVGLSNAGGLRQGDPWDGDVTKADLISLIPFEEPVTLTAVTGTELLAIFREMAAPDVDFGEDDWWHGHVSNARVVWDEAAEEVVEATVGGEPVAPNATYTVAVSEYLLHSDHEFPTLEQRHRVGEAGIQYEVLADYAREFGVDPAIEGRIERRNRD
ncbi:5'-nucleotidase C-terminal domain-containing protein [Halorubrum gandharaense]